MGAPPWPSAGRPVSASPPAEVIWGTDLTHKSRERTRMATAHTTPLAHGVAELLAGLGLSTKAHQGGTLVVLSPITGEVIGRVHEQDAATAHQAINAAHSAFLVWRTVPPPKRGELVRLLGNELRSHKDALGRLVSIEVGKIISEGLGEVQEMIDICDFAVGLSRQLYGLTIATERSGHRMMEQWHPLGVVGVISAFNFPVAVWSWNAALALVCGDALVWKPSEKTPLCAVACQNILQEVVRESADLNVPDAISNVII